MISVEDCKNICNNNVGVEVLRYCFADRVNKSEAFATFCSLFFKGKAASSASFEFARAAQRQIFLTLAGEEKAKEISVDSTLEDVKIGYVEAVVGLKKLGTIRKMGNLRSDDMFTLVILMDCSCNGYISYPDFLSFVGEIIVTLRKIDDKLSSQDFIQSAFLNAVDVVRCNCIQHSQNPVDQIMERKLSRLASAARMIGQSPLATLCHIGDRQKWVLNGSVVHNLITKLHDKIQSNPSATIELENNEPVTPMKPDIDDRLAMRTAVSSSTASRSPRSASTPKRLSSPRVDNNSMHNSPSKSKEKAMATNSPLKSEVSPNAKFAAYQNGDYSLSSLHSNEQPNASVTPSLGTASIAAIPNLLQGLQATVANVSQAIAQQTSQGTLTANTKVWEQLVSLEKQLASVKMEAASGVSSSMPVSEAAASSPFEARNKPLEHEKHNNNGAALTVSDLEISVSPIIANGPSSDLSHSMRDSDFHNRSDIMLNPMIASLVSNSKPTTVLGNRVLKSKSVSNLLHGVSNGRAASVDRSRPQTPMSIGELPSASAGLLSEDNSPSKVSVMSVEVPPVGSLPGVSMGDIVNITISTRLGDNAYDQRFDPTENQIGSIQDLYRDECKKAGKCLPNDGAIRSRPSSRTRSDIRVVKDLFGKTVSATQVGMMKPRSESNGRPGSEAASRASSAGRARPSHPAGHPTSHQQQLGSSIGSSSSSMRGRPQVDMSIFRSPVTLHPAVNTNVFDPQTLKWKPTVKTNKYNSRFQSTQDLILAEKLNSVFYS